MKRIIAFSFFFALVCGAIHAQLPHTFFGATLGVTTKHQAIQSLLAEKANILINGEDYLLVTKVNFDGMPFKNMRMHFYDDILYTVCFDDGETLDYSKESQLNDKYTNLYPSFKYYMIEDNGIFDDDNTKLTITNDFMLFTDMKLEKKETQDNKKLAREIHPYTSTRISETILGCTLGVSTKQQVINALKSLGCKNTPYKSLEGEDAMVLSGISFEGVYFDYIKPTFVDGKLATLMFLNASGVIEQYDINTLHQYFSSRYSAYDITEDIENEFPDTYAYDDDNIHIVISQEGMSYNDKELSEKEQRRITVSLRGKKQ